MSDLVLIIGMLVVFGGLCLWCVVRVGDGPVHGAGHPRRTVAQFKVVKGRARSCCVKLKPGGFGGYSIESVKVDGREVWSGEE